MVVFSGLAENRSDFNNNDNKNTCFECFIQKNELSPLFDFKRALFSRPGNSKVMASFVAKEYSAVVIGFYCHLLLRSVTGGKDGNKSKVEKNGQCFRLLSTNPLEFYMASVFFPLKRIRLFLLSHRFAEEFYVW